ncbi:MAG TPA: ATP-grasp domain-containing protein [Anaeromyxobacter sp.]
MRLRFMLARRADGPSRIVAEAGELLRRRGFDVEGAIAEELVQRPERIGDEADLWLLKSYTPLSLSLAGVLHGAGARLLNPYPGCLAARDKIAAARVLDAAGVPAPRSWVTGDLSLLTPLAREMALVVKPHMGWRGEGVRVVRSEAELLSLPAPREPVLVQEFLPGPGVDLRVYVAGERVFATRKPFSATSFSVPGEQVEVSGEVRRIALRCGEAFGLGLYGLDLIEAPAGPRVVDVNYFHGYKGIAEAPEAVADYIARWAEGSIALAPAPPRPQPIRRPGSPARPGVAGALP